MNDMAMELHTGDGKRLYEQIYEHIRNEIREGKLLQGEKLPSTRTLADYLQVSRSTVDLAYEQLISEGYIESLPYRGYYVSKVEDLFRIPSIREQKTEEKLIKEKSDFDFSPNGIDMSGFPFGVWKKISKNTIPDETSDLFTLGEPQGDIELRRTISNYLHSSRGVNCSPGQIIVGAGNDYLLMLLEKILGRHVKIAMENPTYKRAYRIFSSFAYQITTVDMDENGMRVDKLHAENVTAAYVMPSHQYPTGIVMPIGRRMELLKWAEEAPDRYLIEDDYDSEFRYKGKPVPSLQATDVSGKVIYIGTFSKAIAPAIRVSYMVLPESLLEKYKENCFFFSSTVSRIDQTILNEFIRDGYFERHLNKMRKIYRTKHDEMLSLLKPFLKKFELSGENAGLHILLTSKDGRNEQELVERARNVGVKVYGLSDAYVENNPKRASESQTVILGYGGLQVSQMEEGIARLKQVWL